MIKLCGKSIAYPLKLIFESSLLGGELQVNIPRDALLRIYKSFIKPHLDYGDIIYDKSNNESLKNKIKNIQYNACIAVTGAIQEASRERLYQELGLESLENRRWY